MKNIFNVCTLFFVIVLISSHLISCGKSNPLETNIPIKELSLISEMTLPFTEPSGIAYSEKLKKIWIVSGGDQSIYVLDTNFNVENKLPYKGNDLEGITFDATDSTLWIIDEATKTITHLNRNGNILRQDQLTYTTNVVNKGPEGITIGKNHQLYLVNERDPSILLELDTAFNITQTYQLNFAKDYSDIMYDDSSETFFVLSDESEAFYRLNTKQEAQERYPLPNGGNEGLAYNREQKIFYIVNDATSTLSVFKLK
jgi:uncharacterized protein YjiK